MCADESQTMIDDSKKPLLFTLIVAGVALAVSAPLAFIVGAFVTIVTGTIHATVGSSGTVIFGIVAGVLTTLLVVLYASYATYSFSKAKYIDGTVE